MSLSDVWLHINIPLTFLLAVLRLEPTTSLQAPRWATWSARQPSPLAPGHEATTTSREFAPGSHMPSPDWQSVILCSKGITCLEISVDTRGRWPWLTVVHFGSGSGLHNPSKPCDSVRQSHSIVSHTEGSAHHNVNTPKLALNFNLLKGNYQILKNKMTQMALSGLENTQKIECEENHEEHGFQSRPFSPQQLQEKGLLSEGSWDSRGAQP